MLGLTSIEAQTSQPVRAVTRDNIGRRVNAVNRREAGDELCAHLSHESALAWLGSLRNRVCSSYLNCYPQVESIVHDPCRPKHGVAMPIYSIVFHHDAGARALGLDGRRALGTGGLGGRYTLGARALGLDGRRALFRSQLRVVRVVGSPSSPCCGDSACRLRPLLVCSVICLPRRFTVGGE